MTQKGKILNVQYVVKNYRHAKKQAIMTHNEKNESTEQTPKWQRGLPYVCEGGGELEHVNQSLKI